MKRAKAVWRAERLWRPAALGIDVGGVIVDRVAEGTDTSFFGDRPMETPQVEGAFDAIKALTLVFDGRVHIVSKAGPRIAGLTREWFARHGFFDKTGVSPDHVWFVRKRPEKSPICERLGVTHFVDDRRDVLEALDTVDHLYLFTGGLGTNSPPKNVSPAIHIARTWLQLREHITATLEDEALNSPRRRR